jgi:type VI secretion system secreted protein Hcp
MAKNKASEIFSFSFGSSNPVTVGSGELTGGKVSLSSINVMKRYDQASIALLEACNLSAKIDSGFIVFRRASGDAKLGATPYLTYELVNPRIESVQWSGSAGGDDWPTESVSIAFAAIKVNYSPSDKTGKPDLAAAGITGWDLITNKKV